MSDPLDSFAAPPAEGSHHFRRWSDTYKSEAQQKPTERKNFKCITRLEDALCGLHVRVARTKSKKVPIGELKSAQSVKGQVDHEGRHAFRYTSSLSVSRRAKSASMLRSEPGYWGLLQRGWFRPRGLLQACIGAHQQLEQLFICIMQVRSPRCG